MRRAFLPLLGLLLLAVAGCQKSSTDPTRILDYTGTLTKAAGAVAGVLPMRSTGNALATLVSFEQTNADGTIGAPTVGLDMGIGKVVAGCTVTGTFLFTTVNTSHVSLGLDKGDYCVLFTPTAELADGVSVTYHLQIEVRD